MPALRDGVAVGPAAVGGTTPTEEVGQRMTKHLRNWGAVYILAAAWVASSLVFAWSHYYVVLNDAAQHGQTFEWSDYWPSLWTGFFENLQSEWAQLAVQALLISAYSRTLFRKGDEDMLRLERKVDALLYRDP